MAELYAVEYLTRAGWAGGHAGIALQDPQTYVNKMAKRLDDDKAGTGAWGRAVPLDTRLQRVVADALTPPALPSFEGAPAPTPATSWLRIVECAACGGPHPRPWGCLL